MACDCFKDTEPTQSKPLEIKVHCPAKAGQQMIIQVSGTPGGDTTDLVVTLDSDGKATTKLDPTPAGWDEAIITAGGCDPAGVIFI